MVKQYIEEMRRLPDGSAVRGKFAVRGKEAVRDYKAKEGKFFTLELADRTGSIPLKYWGGADPRFALELYNSLRPGDVVMLTGTVGIDRFDNVQVVTVNEGTHLLKKVERLDPDELAEYLPATKRDREAMMAELDRAVGSIMNPHLKSLMLSFFSDPAFRKRYASSPSAMVHHHNYIGGNLEHSLNVLRLCLALCEAYPRLDRDLLMAGAMLHDVGKLDEYATSAAIVMSDAGRFLGHVAIGGMMVARRMSELQGFPPELAMKLSHLLAQHHGSFDPNRLKGMKLPEAAALHFADEADAQTKEMLQAVEAAQDSPDPWSYNRQIGNEIYTK